MEAGTTPGSMVLLTRLTRLVYRRATEDVLGMRAKQYIALTHLGDGGVPQQALGKALMLDANNLVLLLNELEDAGWVQRRRDPEDRRRHIVEITAAGREAVERAERGMESIEDEALAALSAAERAALRRLLAKAIEGAAAEP